MHLHLTLKLGKVTRQVQLARLSSKEAKHILPERSAIGQEPYLERYMEVMEERMGDMFKEKPAHATERIDKLERVAEVLRQQANQHSEAEYFEGQATALALMAYTPEEAIIASIFDEVYNLTNGRVEDIVNVTWHWSVY